MRFFIDTANIEEIKALNALGFVDGVTTNPSLIAKSGQDFVEVIKQICSIISGPVSAEVLSVTADEMVKEGESLSKIASNVVVKIPLTWDGLKACKILSSKNIKTNVTLCFSVNQALLAAKAGATYVSPFVGRLDDIGEDGMSLIKDILDVYRNYPDLNTEILVASIRNPEHVFRAASIGADVATIPPKIMSQLVKHPLTDKGLEAFLKDCKDTNQQIKV